MKVSAFREPPHQPSSGDGEARRGDVDRSALAVVEDRLEYIGQPVLLVVDDGWDQLGTSAKWGRA